MLKRLNVMSMTAAAVLLLAVSLVFPPVHVAHAGSSSSEFVCQKASWTPGALLTLTQATTTVTCPGANLGDFVDCSAAAADVTAITLSCQVSAANTVRLVAFNSSAGSLTPPSGAYNVRIWQFYKSP